MKFGQLKIILSALPKEVIDLVKKFIKEGMKPTDAVKKAWEEYKKSQKASIETKDTEIANLKTELAKKEQEINELKDIKKELEDKSQTDLDVGTVDNSPDAYKTKRASIDKKAFGEKKN